MSYNSERYKKSVLTTCSRARTVVPGSSDLVEVSDIVHCSGASIECANGHHVLKHKGLYRADAKMIFTADKNGSVIAWIALDNTEVHCSRVVFNVCEGQTVSLTLSVPGFCVSEGCHVLTLHCCGTDGICKNSMLATTKLA